MMRKSKDELRCSFCHKAQEVVGKLISSPSDFPTVYICDECIAVCNSILGDNAAGIGEEATCEADRMREQLASLLAWIPDDQLATVGKILNSLADYSPKPRTGPGS